VSLSVPNFEAPAEYTEPATIRLRGATRASVTVTNGACYAQILRPGRPDLWDPEEFLVPGVHTWARPLDAIRVRSAVAAQAARVSVTITHAREAGDAR
jgi:hypothetical protein